MQELNAKDMYFVHEDQLKSMCDAIDVLTLIHHACEYREETGKGVTAGVIASAVRMASCALSEIIDDIEDSWVIAQLSREVGKEAC